MAESYLRDEFEKVEMCDELDEIGCSISMPNEFDPFKWKAVFIGPKNSAYHGGFFRMDINFPSNYPEKKPEVRFINKIYHLNVSPTNGHICISTLNEWKPKTPMVDVISAIFALFYDQNPRSPYSGEMAREYEHDRNTFNQKAREWTQKYAKM